jgi:tetratricopeptide (TPR) repeat protein
VWLPVVLAALAIIYLPGLGNALVFDDEALSSGRLFADYAALLELRSRVLSYGSFVWVREIFGDGWWKQRLMNLAIHVAVVLALWGLWREILRHVVPGAEPGEAAPAPLESSPAVGVAIGFFALNPVAVYGVGYLIQRSILMATFFVALSLWLFLIGCARGHRWMLVPALVCYALGVASKEYAILAPLAAVPLFILAVRPSGKTLGLLALAGGVVVGAMGLALSVRYGEILGKPFDEMSQVYLAQLAALDPLAPQRAFPLSIENQAWLFFQYGLRWVIPASLWLSINLRPPFPVTFATFPQVLGIVGYLAVVAGGFWLLLRHRDWRALLGVSLLMPALLFATEFATVWVQDPFVLYRSYLWAIGIPGLVVLAAQGIPTRILAGGALLVGCLLTWQALDRVLSLATPERAWSDAIAKLPDDPRSVGRWFAYLNRGAAYVDANRFNLAMQDFESSSKLGDMGSGLFNRGSLYAANGEHANALASFAVAERQGYNLYSLPFQRALSLAALGQPQAAYGELQRARAMNPPSPTRELVLLHMGRMAVQLGRPDEAVALLDQFLTMQPDNAEARYTLAMALVMKKDFERARGIADAVVAQGDTARARYVRALAHYGLGRKDGALADIEAAIRMSGETPHLAEWRAKIKAMK